MSTPPPPPPPGGTPPPPPVYGQGQPAAVGPNGKPYAEWIWRVLAFLIDYVPAMIISGIGWLCMALFTTTVTTNVGYGYGYEIPVQTSSTSFIGLLLALLFYLIALVYFFWNKGYREGSTGKSIGKQLTGYTTLNEQTGQPLGAGAGILRLILLWVDFLICYVGVLWPLWDPKKQCLLSDRVTNAVVTKD